MIPVALVLSLLGAVAGGFVLFLSVNSYSISAPQQAAAAGFALGLAVIPYVIARCMQLLWNHHIAETRHKELLRALGAAPEFSDTRPAAPVVWGHPDTPT